MGVNDTFTGVSSVDTMQVISTPAQPAYPYTPAESFAVRLVTPQGNADSYQAVTFTAPPGVKFAGLWKQHLHRHDGLERLGRLSDHGDRGGNLSFDRGLRARDPDAGVYGDGPHPDLERDQHADDTWLRTPLHRPHLPRSCCRMELPPVAGADVTLQGASGDVMMTACGLPACSLTTDAHGIISSDVIPLRAGVIPLTASIGPMAATANMTVTGVPRLPGGGGGAAGERRTGRHLPVPDGAARRARRGERDSVQRPDLDRHQRAIRVHQLRWLELQNSL